MTKIAIPCWQGRVSPVFDVAGLVILAKLEGGLIVRQGELALGAEVPQSRSAILAASGVEVLICGAISCCFEWALRSASIEVISQICGEIEQVLQAYANGQLNYCRMPGCRAGRGQPRHGHGRRRRFRI